MVSVLKIRPRLELDLVNDCILVYLH